MCLRARVPESERSGPQHLRSGVLCVCWWATHRAGLSCTTSCRKATTDLQLPALQTAGRQLLLGVHTYKEMLQVSFIWGTRPDIIFIMFRKQNVYICVVSLLHMLCKCIHDGDGAERQFCFHQISLKFSFCSGCSPCCCCSEWASRSPQLTTH